MSKRHYSADTLLKQLGELSSYLTGIDNTEKDCFDRPLEIMQRALYFHVSVLYKITNVIEDDLILEVLKVLDPQGNRPDLKAGAKISINLANPDKAFINEANSFKGNNISAINVPGKGCDMVGFVYLPDNFGGGYLFGGDYWGEESAVQDYEVSVCEIMCNILSSILIKTQFEQLAIYDSLTGLFNSRAIREQLQKAFKRYQRKKNTSTAIVLGDIDFFKKINDQYGHIQGDSVLEEVGRLIMSAIRTDFDFAGRYGGEEFLFIFEETDAEKAFNIIERFREKVSAHKFKRIGENGLTMPEGFLNVTMSFGISFIGEDRNLKEPNELLSAADAALYKSKTAGRNKVTIG